MNYTLKDIKDNYEECLTKEQMYILYPQDKKQKVYIAYNSSDLNNFKINRKSQNDNSLWIDVKNIIYLYAYGQEDSPLYFSLIYLEKDIIDLNLYNQFSFKLITQQKIKFNITILNNEYNIILHIASKYKLMNADISLEGAISETGSKLINNAEEYTTIITREPIVMAEIQFKLKNSAKYDEITISYNYKLDYEDIIGSKIIFFEEQIKEKNYLLLLSGVDKYYEIINYYGNILLFMDDKIISNLTGGEQSYYFMHNNSNYVLQFSTPLPFQKSGFQIVCSNEERSSILISSLDLYLFKEREFELIVKNIKSEKRLVSIETSISSSDELKIETVSGMENGELFIPLNEDKFYYLILEKELTFKIKVTNSNNKSNSFNIILSDKSLNKITTSGIITPKSGIIFYNILNSEDYYILYFQGEIPLYNFEGNIKIIPVKSNERKKKSDYEILYYNYSKSNESFYIDFQDEKNTKNEEGDFSIILYKPIKYDFILVNINEKAKRIQIKFKQNEYYSISKFEIANQNIEINYLFLDSELKESEDLTRFYLSYLSFNKDMVEIKQDYSYIYITSEEMYEIQYDNNKQYIEVIYNTSSNYFKLNGKGENNQIFLPTTKNNYLNILGSPEENICFQITYYQKDIFDLKLDQELNFNIIMVQNYSLKISDIEEIHNVELYIKTENDNLEEVNIYLSGGEKQSIAKNDNIYNCTLIEPNKEITLDFKFIPKKNKGKEKATIYYKLVRSRPRIPEGFLNFAHYYTYVVYGIFVLSLVLLGIEKCFGIKKKLTYSRIFERLGSVYLCKRD